MSPIWRVFLGGMAILAAASAFFAFMTLPAPAQQTIKIGQCGPKPAMLQWLRDFHSEFPAWTGTAKGGEIIITRADRGTWTVLIIEGPKACIVRAGVSNRFDAGT